MGAGRRRVRAHVGGQRRPATRARRAVAGGRALTRPTRAPRRPRPIPPNVARYPQPFEPALEARWRLAPHRQGRRPARPRTRADAGDPAGRPQRRRGAHRAHALPRRERRRSPSRCSTTTARSRSSSRSRQLKLKKAKTRERAFKAYSVAADYGVADVTTAATFRLAALCQDFGKGCSRRSGQPKLSKKELEQYNVLLSGSRPSVRGEGDRAARTQRPARRRRHLRPVGAGELCRAARVEARALCQDRTH